MTVLIEELRTALEQGWGPDTCYDASEWTEQNPARGQCVATSLVIQEYLGGDLMKFETIYEGKLETHYFNVLPNGNTLDLSRQQYPPDQQFSASEINLHGYPTAKDKMLAESGTVRRYKLLLGRVVTALSS